MAMRLRLGTPVWLGARHTPGRRRYPAARGRYEADVAIVGGGITGALIAAEFAAAGVSVILLESGLAARGSTAASAALLLQEPDLGLHDLEARYGRAAGQRIWTLAHEAVRGLIETIRRHQITCDLRERDAVYYTRDAEALAPLRKEFERRGTAGFDGEWLSPGALQKTTGIEGLGAIRTSGGAQCDPYEACLGLLQVAARSGAQIFERSRVRRIDRVTAGMRLRTGGATIDAARVVIATGYATRQFRPLAGRFRMKRTFVLVTSPLSRGERQALGLADVMLWNTRRPYHYARWTPDHRLLVGGGDRPQRSAPRAAQLSDAVPKLRDEFERVLPGASRLNVEYAWEGLFAMTPDGLPYIGPHRRYPGHLFALGYGGNGMTFSFLAARLLLEQWRNIRSPDHRLFSFGRTRRLLNRRR
jgi:glycine/D-amino acid oxidase-like deaminating enzyme